LTKHGKTSHIYSDFKGMGEPLSTSEIDIYTLPHTSNEISKLYIYLSFLD